CEDYEFWIRATSRYEVCLVDKVLTVKAGGHPDQLSAKYWGMDRFRIKAIAMLMESGSLDSDQYRTAYLALEKKCRIFSAGCRKRGRLDDAGFYEDLLDKYSIID
ncbi:glycosyltransferase family 2 protein, partial [Elusimicrobiota bacterium]